MARKLFTNARVVSPDEVFLGTVEWHAGRIVRVEIGATSVPGAEDLAGDYLLPGLVKPAGLRSSALPWGSGGIAAMVETDLAAASSGITTVFDVFDLPAHADASAWATVTERLAWLEDGATRGALRCHHAVQWRVPEGTADDLPPAFAMLPRHRLGKLLAVSPDTLARFDEIGAMAHSRALTLAAADVRNSAEVALCVLRGVDRLMFPDAPMADWPDLSVLHHIPMWPAAVSETSRPPRKLGASDALDVSGPALDLLCCPFLLRESAAWPLPLGIAAVTARAARFAGLHDRGAIAVGQRADFVRVRDMDGVPVPMSTWRGGERIA